MHEFSPKTVALTQFGPELYRDYAKRLEAALATGPMDAVARLAETLAAAVRDRRQVFLAGNGGSAANAMHLANDFLYGVGRTNGLGMRVEALGANPAVVTCLANDVSYDEIFAEQLRRKASAGDALVVLSGSGNSSNVVRALETARGLAMDTFAVLGYSGGRCRTLADVVIHFPVDDMQVAEDLQLIVGHMCMQWIERELARTSPLA